MRLKNTLPPTTVAPGDPWDVFPTRYSALEWLGTLRQQEVSAGELYLTNAVMGAQRAVLKAYLEENNIPIDSIPRPKPEVREDFFPDILEFWAENLAVLNPAMEQSRSVMELSFSTPEARKDLDRWSAAQPPAFRSEKPIFAFLSEPFTCHPSDLSAQAEFMLQSWRPWLGDWSTRLIRGLDYIKEEQTLRLTGPGPVSGPDYSGTWAELSARYSSDRDWMPSVVMIAKNTFVWLDQLSHQYRRKISRLNEIPEEALRQLSVAGFNVLWLIGIWERSSASKTIKQWCGNPEAEASAYAIKRYDIAEQLGGRDALASLKSACERQGIRLASDMVPNHTALDSDWLMDHPDWFVSRPDKPFPGYTFSGENLSGNDRVGIYLEDHYFTQSDAAVVFKRVDHETGEQRFIYHGNDGTTMPWNDTAQLNYLNADLREAIMQTILAVARQFPVIRFDAAMTLTRKHYQRLWFPVPGSGSDIPSRSENAMSDEEFKALMPTEFWREVVDRVAKEAPDTLLLAEAFWLMEGYFVRTLGMHRVYNSAFMNMLKMERNQDYRKAIRDTLAFDPDILKRYVNFMSNPDEETARTQFGDGDKYFAVATLLATLPGLPLWGHGQTEGYREKYGMEFRRAYGDESPDDHLVEEHWRRIFPLFHQRELFADVTAFRLYDFYTGDGLDENVFAYSNRHGDRSVIVLVNNAFGTSHGSIRESVPFRNKTDNTLETESLLTGLDLTVKDDQYLIYRDMIHHREYIRSGAELNGNGFVQTLKGYQAFVFSDFSVRDGSAGLQAVCHRLAGQGVDNLEKELILDELQPAHDWFVKLIRALLTGEEKRVREGLSQLAQQIHSDPGSEVFDPESCLPRIVEQYSLIESRKRQKPEWAEPPSTLLAVTVLARSMDPKTWLKLYDELWLSLALERYLALDPAQWDATWLALRFIGEQNLPALITTLPEGKIWQALFHTNEWEGVEYIEGETWKTFFSLCFWLNISGWKEIYPLAELHQYRLADIISALPGAISHV